MNIYTFVSLAVADANRQAREISMDHAGLIMAVVTHDRSGIFVSWATTEQKLADNEVECGWWRHGKKQ